MSQNKTSNSESLDEKLREILEDWYPGTQYSDVIPKLKTAFIDAGYQKPIFPNKLVDDVFTDIHNGMLSGEQWLARFEKEYKTYHPLLAARKAAGLDSNNENT